jgi:hypothetical protein
MQLGKALLGAIIGACVGIVLLIVVYLAMGIDKVWLSIPFALVTGLGVRMFVSTSGHASYVRGALTMVIALVAYIGGWLLVPQVISARADAASAKTSGAREEKPAAEPGDTDAKDTEAKDADATDETKEADEAPKAAPPKAVPRTTDSGMPRAATLRDAWSPWDIICLAVAALVAYEMGRGSGMATATSPSAPSAPAGTHPDA